MCIICVLHRKPIPVEVLSRLTKFYVANLPERRSGADLAKDIRNFGNIYDIYIASKRDKEGNRFGFVSLLDVKDRKEMERILSAIRLGDYRLKVNVARFVLEDGEINSRKPTYPVKDKKLEEHERADYRDPLHGPRNVYSANSMSFKEAFDGASKGKSIVIDDNISAFEDLHGRSVVVKVASLEVLRMIKGILKEMGLGEGSVHCLGGFMMLISFKTRNHATMAKDEFLGRPEQFSLVDIWEGQHLPFERIAWIKVVGLPLCVLDDRVIDNIGSFFGTVVRKPAVKSLETDSLFHFIGVLVGQGARIHEV
ncbi:putative RNA recognition motif domain, nucleotide-binding alpha-beta plait domain superfamily [Helianthus annuus]|nr:putative RNA recognition motif domain, nucleotide-binding alpha-beta plait domain superfamily [Helianthus annuus]